MSKQKQIIEIKECIDAVYGADCAYYDVDGFAIANEIYNAGYRKQEWISVDERLPDNHRTVLVACKGITVAGAVPIAVGSYGVGHWFLADAEGTLYLTKYMHIVVTHWMPLPEAPKMKGGAE